MSELADTWQFGLSLASLFYLASVVLYIVQFFSSPSVTMLFNEYFVTNGSYCIDSTSW